MDEAIDAQLEIGVEELMLPTKVLSSTDWPDEFQGAVDAARRAWSRRDLGTEPFLTVILHETWLTDKRLRRTLLNQLTDLPENLNVALQVLWDSGDAATDAGRLEALATVVRVLASDTRKVLLIDAGMIGWLSIAWGGWGFAPGLSMMSWLRHTAEIRRASGQPTTRVKRYFEKSLLHRVRQPAHIRLEKEDKYEKCPCPFCADLKLISGENWDYLAADQHALYSLAELTDEISAPRLKDRSERIRRRIDAAIEYYASTDVTLTGDSKPSQLYAWRSVV